MTEQQKISIIPKIIPEEGVTFSIAGGRRVRLFPNGSMVDEATGRTLKGTAPNGQESQVSLRSASKYGHLNKHTVSATAKKLVDYGVLCRTVEVQADSTNAGDVYIGGEGVTSSEYGYAIRAGESKVLDVSDPSTIYVIGTASDTLRIGYLQ